jgi:hypothetical protein
MTDVGFLDRPRGIAMRVRNLLMAAWAAVAALLAVAEPAQAHGSWRSGVVLHFGYPGPYYWGPRYWYPPPPVYYYPAPPVVVAPPAPPVYVERDDEPAPPSTRWWYWCPSAKGYYPYVKECPGGWQRVPPQPVD